jgi:glutamate-1-semialdehyde 2,1-aminomutase
VINKLGDIVMKSNSQKLFSNACKVIPGGVNSPVRSFSNVNSTPTYIKSGKDCRVYDNDSNEYLDYCGSWGPLILGHAYPKVIEAVVNTAKDGLTFGTCNEKEIEFAEIITELVPHVEMVRAVNSGTEAVMTAIRLARAATDKDHILKFTGCYHGHSDSLLVEAGSGLLDNPIPSSSGIPDSIVSKTVTVSYNDIEAVKEAFRKYQFAAVIIEPIACNMGLVLPKDKFLNKVEKLCKSNNTLLIFDEVITGFRFHAGAYSSLINIIPDLTVFGKIIGGGMPIGAVGGRKEIMELLAPLGSVYQAGTLSGNPVALAAGIATLKELRDTKPYVGIQNKSDLLESILNDSFGDKDFNGNFSIFKGVFTLFFNESEKIRNLDDVKKCNLDRFANFHKFMLNSGVYLSPSQFEVNFISAAHSLNEIEKTAELIIKFFKNK